MRGKMQEPEDGGYFLFNDTIDSQKKQRQHMMQIETPKEQKRRTDNFLPIAAGNGGADLDPTARLHNGLQRQNYTRPSHLLNEEPHSSINNNRYRYPRFFQVPNINRAGSTCIFGSRYSSDIKQLEQSSSSGDQKKSEEEEKDGSLSSDDKEGENSEQEDGEESQEHNEEEESKLGLGMIGEDDQTPPQNNYYIDLKGSESSKGGGQQDKNNRTQQYKILQQLGETKAPGQKEKPMFFTQQDKHFHKNNTWHHKKSTSKGGDNPLLEQDPIENSKLSVAYKNQDHNQTSKPIYLNVESVQNASQRDISSVIPPLSSRSKQGVVVANAGILNQPYLQIDFEPSCAPGESYNRNESLSMRVMYEDDSFASMIRVDHHQKSGAAAAEPSLEEGAMQSAHGGTAKDEQQSSQIKSIVNAQDQANFINKYDPKSLFIFSDQYKFRRLVSQLADSKYFEYFMIGVIILNSLALALYDYSDRDSLTTYNQVIDEINKVFTYMFILEATIKVIAQGFVLHPNAYLRSGWNIIDAAVVLSGTIELSIETVKLKSLRIMRIFRPLKSINTLPGMRKLISALIQSIPEFTNVMVFLAFVFVLFAIIGLHQFNGAFYNACRLTDAPVLINDTWSWPFDESIGRVCTSNGLGNFQCPNAMPCGNPETYYEIDLETEDMFRRDYINYGITNFDNIGFALLSVFQIITGDTWKDFLFNFYDSDIPTFGGVYVIMMIVVGQFFLLNLFLAVIVFAFVKQSQEELQEEIMQLNAENHQLEEQIQPIKKEQTIYIMDLDQVDEKFHKPHEPGQVIDNGQTSEQSVIRVWEPKNDKANKTLAPNSGAHTTKRAIKKILKRSHSIQGFPNIMQIFEGNHQKQLGGEEQKVEKSAEHLSLSKFLKPMIQKRRIANMFMGQIKTKKTVEPESSGHNELISGDNIPAINSSELGVNDEGSFKYLEIMKKMATSQPELKKLSDHDLNLEEIKEEEPSNINLHPSNNEPIDEQQSNPHIEFQELEDDQRTSSNSISEEQKSMIGLEEIEVESPEQQDPNQTPVEGEEEEVKKEPEESPTLNKLNSSGPLEASSIDQVKFQRIQRALRNYIKKKIEQECEAYLKRMVEEAKEFNGTMQTTKRELVGIKVGLEYIKEQQEGQAIQDDNNKYLHKRRKQWCVYRWSYKIQESLYFQWSITSCIVINTLILALDKYPEKEEINVVTEKLNMVFSIIFIFELIIRMLAFGIVRFFRGSGLNSFDCVIVVGSIVDMIISNVISNEGSNGGGSMITVLRGVRLLRVFKLAKKWRRFELLLETMGKTLKDIGTFVVFLFLFIFIFTLMALELFAYKAKIDPDTNMIDNENGVSPTFNFDTFFNSFSLIFIILTNEAQSAIYYDYYRAVGPAASTIFFVLMVIVGQKVIINLFVAILLENFDEGALKEKLHDYEERQLGQDFMSQVKAFKDMLIKKIKTFICQRIFHKKTVLINDPQALEEQEPKSLYLFNSENKFRKLIQKIVESNVFDYAILLTIVLSSIQIALDSPIMDPESRMKQILFWIDIATTIIFCMEALLKIISFGFFLNGPHSYLLQPWNLIDFLIIFFSLLSYTPLSNSFAAFKVLRILRLIGRNEGLKIAVKALLRAVPNIINITLIMLLFLIIFGIIFVSQFKGKFYFCEEAAHTVEEITSKWDCMNSGGLWSNQVYTFDDIQNALITLFTMSTTAGWMGVLYNSVASTQIDYVIGTQMNILWTLIFMLFMIIGFFFFLNLFIGVVVTTFNYEQDKLGGNDLLTEKQKEWIDLKLLVLRSQPIKKIRPPKNKFRRYFYNIQSKKQFDQFIFLCIFFNTVILTLKWFRQSDSVVTVLEYLNYIFTSIFIIEAVIKILGQGAREYFKDAWNRFDFIVAIGSFGSIMVGLFSALKIKGATTLVRSFRLLRIFRILKRGGRSIQLIFNTFLITIQTLSNIGSLLLLIIYMYSVMGMILFGTIKRNGDMNDYLNFENFINSFITIFILTTGDSWDSIQTSFVINNQPNTQCIWNPTYEDYVQYGETVGCGGKLISYIFFSSFTFIINLIFLQLFIAVILQGYEDTQIQEARLFNGDMTQKFREVWSDFDPEATTFINMNQLRPFLLALGEPLGFDKSYHGRRFFQDRFIAQLDIPTYHNFTQYQFLDVLDALSFRLMVLDNIKKKFTNEQGGEQLSKEKELERVEEGIEVEMKNELSKEINRLIYQRKNENIKAAKDMFMKEQRKSNKGYIGKDKQGFTSSHQMAAEATVRKMRSYLKRKREQKYLIEIPEVIHDRGRKITTLIGMNFRKLILRHFTSDPEQKRMRDLTSLEHTVGAPDYENVPDEPPELPLIGGNYENEGSIIEQNHHSNDDQANQQNETNKEDEEGKQDYRVQEGAPLSFNNNKINDRVHDGRAGMTPYSNLVNQDEDFNIQEYAEQMMSNGRAHENDQHKQLGK